MSGQFVIGWAEVVDWDRHDGDFVMMFEGATYESISLAARHADEIARGNGDYVFIVLDESDACATDPIVHIVRRMKL